MPNERATGCGGPFPVCATTRESKTKEKLERSDWKKLVGGVWCLVAFDGERRNARRGGEFSIVRRGGARKAAEREREKTSKGKKKE